MNRSVEKQPAEVIHAQELLSFISGLNATCRPYPANSSIKELFEEQVRKSPNATALESDTLTLTYAELNRRSNQLANHLLSRGVQPEECVLIVLPRSVESVVAHLAVVKTGAFYVPLDPDTPAERVRFVARDCGALRALTNLEPQESSQPDSIEWIDCTPDILTSYHAPTENPAVHCGQIVSVMYTSGSTGLPKGVLIPHRGIARLVLNNECVQFEPGDCVAHSSNPAFDASTLEIWGALLNGAKLLIVPRADVLNSARLAQTIRNRGVTILFQTTALFNLHAHALPSLFAGLRYALFGGDRADPAAVRRVLDASAPKHLINLYGPTETSVVATWHPVLSVPERATHIPIGRPISNTRVYVLDARGEPVPVGECGEIYVGGPGVAHGYLNRPALTHERFVPDPWGEAPGDRLYKTGDRARWLSDGTIEFLGRADGQIKLRGYRIEPGEIETRLAEHSSVAEAVVIAREDTPGDKRLVGYVRAVGTSSVVPTPDMMRAHLRESLPEYMVPSAFVLLEAFPITSNGKLDRAALPAPELDATANHPYEAPQGPHESLVAKIWEKLLHLEGVGRHDNFYELGGHSLLLAQMVQSLGAEGFTTDLSQSLANPTVATLAANLCRDDDSGMDSSTSRIPQGTSVIAPDMLPLVSLQAEHIERITKRVPGGASNIEDIYPLAPLQEGILFHHLMSAGEGDTYVLPTLFSLSSRAKLDAFIVALESVIARHDILRTAVLWEGLPQPVQVVYRRAPLSVEELATRSDIRAELERRMLPEHQRIDLNTAPLMNLIIAPAPSGQEWYALLQLHHMAHDHESLEAVLAETMAFIEGREDRLLAPAPYRDHIAAMLTRGRERDDERFFRDKLGDVTEPTAPFGLLDVRGTGGRIDQARLPLDPELARQVRAAARGNGFSAAAVFHAAWALVTAQTSGRDDVVYGTVLLGRMQTASSAQQMLGLFINTLPLRVRLGDRTALELVKATHRELTELLTHEQASLALAQRCSALPPGAPLFTTLLNYVHSTPHLEIEKPKTTAGIEIVSTKEWTNYPIVVSVDDLGSGFILTVQADRQLDAASLATYLATAVRELVVALNQEPTRPLARLSILSQEDRLKLIEEFNPARIPFAAGGLFHEHFERQARATPALPAVVHEGISLSYSELNAAANRLARQLRSRGVGRDRLVALCLDRDTSVLVGLLAVLKAGGAYVPLDPTHPPERLAAILQDARPVCVLVQDATSHVIPSEFSTLTIDGSEDLQDPGNLGVKQIGLEPRHLAYVIYTSGSTGKPKGVMVEHQCLLDLWQSLKTPYSVLGAGMRVALNASINFDASVQQLVQLASGSTVFFMPHAARRDAKAAVDFIRCNRITAIDCIPAQLKTWLAAGLLEGPPTDLRLVLVGGEAIEPSLWRSVAQSLEVDFYNVYGPTECTVDATAARINADTTDPHIGRPMLNRRVYILDGQGRPVPIGVAGELYIGGAGIARGYLNRETLTRERFLPDPFDYGRNGRMYKTGDLVRWRSSGVLEYLGRNDDQVKIRGYRIELGEIEAQLTRHEHVDRAVVLTREDVPGDKRLVAYVTPKADVRPTVRGLRQHLAVVLPEYMIPSAFVVTSQLPVTISGKVDRAALPRPDLPAYLNRAYEAPQTEIESLLAKIWVELLGVSRVGRLDNFFELGGHSLLVVRLLDQLKSSGRVLRPGAIFERPVLKDMATAVLVDDGSRIEIPPNRILPGSRVITPDMLPLVSLTEQQIAAITNAVPGGAANIQDIYPLAPLQEGILFHHLFERDRGESAGDVYVASAVFALTSRSRSGEVLNALDALLERHDILRTAILWQDLPRAVQVVLRKATMPVVEVVATDEADARARLDALTRLQDQWIDLQQAPLARIRIVRCASGPADYLVLQLHHIVGDNTALETIVAEIRAHLRGELHTLPAPGRYRDHVAQTLKLSAQSDSEEYFKRKLGDVDEPTAPFGMMEVHGNGQCMEHAKGFLGRELAERLTDQARRRGVTAATLFHAIWGLVVAKTSGRNDVVFGTVLLGRLQGHAATSQAVGMFINTLPLRLQLKNATASDLIDLARRELIELLEHEQASLAVAQRCSALTGARPLFSALLNYRHGGTDLEAAFDDVEGIESLGMKSGTNYPLLLSIDDLGEDFQLVLDARQPVDPTRMLGYVKTAAESLVTALESAPDEPALSLKILPASERLQVTSLFNSIPMAECSGAVASARTVQDLFEIQANRTPHATAVEYEGRSLTYEQLNSQANRLARWLLSRGVKSDDIVGICLERSLQMVVGLLGILKAGAAYLPLDPNYPTSRLRHMLEDAGPNLVLTESHLAQTLPGTAGETVEMDRISLDLSAFDVQDLDEATVARDGSHLVYAIFTSGSTGRPKGTAMPHRAMVNLIEWHRATFGPGEGARVLQFAALSFDVAFQDTFSTLCTGGTLVLVDEWTRKDPMALLEYLSEQRITRLFVTPVMLQGIADCYEPDRSPRLWLTDVIAAGEQLRISPALARFFGSIEGCQLHNHYGPTETHVVTALTLSGDPATWPSSPNIGRPLPNTRVLILDGERQPVPIGVPGEMYIGGVALAREYLHRPELTAERFATIQLEDEQARLYKTGDIGKWETDGTITYVGRNDEQVKVRGYRIELGEVESQLMQHPDVRETAVVVRSDSPGEKSLVAYVILRDEARAVLADLREYLRSTLPDHMVPSAIVALESWPTTPSGKLDRRALPAPANDAYVSRRYESPRGELEIAMAQIWQEVLGLERVGRDDHFFDLGGHSLLAMQVIARVRTALSVDMPMRLLFEAPVLRQLSEKMEVLRKTALLEIESGEDIDALLEKIASLPEAEVARAVEQLNLQGRARP